MTRSLVQPGRALLLVLTLAALDAGAVTRLCAQPGMDSVKIGVQKITDHVYMLTGAGGNMGLSIGAEGSFLVDDQFAPLTEKIKAAIATVSDKPVRFVLNTHYHGDHTGGNENFGMAGAVIVAQDNVRKRMSVDQFNKTFNMAMKASPHVALPVVTFAQSVTFHVNEDSVVFEHVPPAHTDGDALVFFRKANVIHAGDTFFIGLYPIVDISGGGSVNGLVDAADRMLRMANADTKIIPGHGPLGTVADLKEYRTMLGTIRDRVRAQIAAGKTLDQVKAAKPSREFDEKWGKAYLKPDQFVEVVYSSLKGEKPSPGTAAAAQRHHGETGAARPRQP